MPKSRHRDSPLSVPVLALRWIDAKRAMRTQYVEDLPELVTIGALVGETDKAYILAHEAESHSTYMNEEMDLVWIPKAIFIDRQDVGNVKMFPEPEVK